MLSLIWKAHLGGALLLLAGTIACRRPAPEGQVALRFRAYEFLSAQGDRVPAALAYLRVPENRERPNSRSIELAVLRFPSTAASPGNPIVYLAGGPGSSAVEAARGARFAAFMALRNAGDVIALEQRGTGLSRPNLTCPERVGVPPEQPLSREFVAQSAREAAIRCAALWRRRGADLAGYNAVESADDLEALRSALGAEHLVLWGSSYGTQLALVTMRRHPALASRAILAGVQGPDDTWPLPSTIDRRFDTLARLGLSDVFRALVGKLDSTPIVVRVARPQDPRARTGRADTVSLAISGLDVLSFVAGTLDDPGQRSRVPALLAALSQGDWRPAAPMILRTREPRSIGSAMMYATACASGISVARRQRMAREAARSILAAMQNVTEATCDVWGARDLGEAFRQRVTSPVPTLLISGTADFTTPIENAVVVLRGLSLGQHLILEGARHGPELVTGAEVITRMLDFLEGRPLSSLRVRVR